MVLRYSSGKGPIAHPVAVVLSRLMREHNLREYAEPFVGMFRVGTEVVRTMRPRVVHMNDTNGDIVCWWHAVVCTPWVPEAVPQTEAQYKAWLAATPSAQRTMYGLSLSFRGAMCGTINKMYNTDRVMQRLLERVLLVKSELQNIPEVVHVTR